MIGCGLIVDGWLIGNYEAQNITETNTVDGKPVYYLVNKTRETVKPNGGQIFLVNCSDISVTNQILTNGYCGITLVETNNSWITSNIIYNNTYCGLNIISGSRNHIHHNNFIENGWAGKQAYDNYGVNF